MFIHRENALKAHQHYIILAKKNPHGEKVAESLPTPPPCSRIFFLGRATAYSCPPPPRAGAHAPDPPTEHQS